MSNDHELVPFLAMPATLVAARAAAALETIAPETAPYGLALTHSEALRLAAVQTEALAGTGRVEFGDGIAKALALAFCDSPYLIPAAWADTLAELTELFYQLKGVCGERLGDAELLAAMRLLFDATGGDTGYLAGAEADCLLAASKGECPPTLAKATFGPDGGVPYGADEQEDL